MRRFLSLAAIALMAGMLSVIPFSFAMAQTKPKAAPKPPISKEPELTDIPQKTRDFCQIYGAKKSEVVFLLIDRTTEFKSDSKSARDIRAATERALDFLRPHQRLVVYNLSNDPGKRKTLFDACRPGIVENFLKDAFKRRMTPDEEKHLRIDGEDFVKHLRQQIEAEIAYPRKDSPSAIVDTLVYRTSSANGDKIVGLIIASDMIDNERLGMKSPFPPLNERQQFEMVEKLTNSGQLAKLNVDTMVHIFGFGVIDEPDRKPLNTDTRDSYEKFWREFFARSRTKVQTKFE